MKATEVKTIYELAFQLLKQAAKGSLIVDYESKARLTTAGLWGDLEDMANKLMSNLKDDRSEIRQSIKWARETQKYGLNCSMIDQNQRTQEQNLRVFITELSTKTLKGIANKLEECDKAIRKAVESANSSLPLRNVDNTTNIVQLADSLHSFASKLSNNILTIHRASNQPQIQPAASQSFRKFSGGGQKQLGWKQEKGEFEGKLQRVQAKLESTLSEKQKLEFNLREKQAQIQKYIQKIQQLSLSHQSYKAQIDSTPTNRHQPLDISFQPHEDNSFHSPILHKNNPTRSYCVTPSQFYHIREKAFSPPQKSQAEIQTSPVEGVILQCININSEIETVLQGRVKRLEKEIKRRDTKLMEYSGSNKAYEKQIDECLKEELQYRLEIKGLQAREKQYRHVLGLRQGETLENTIDKEGKRRERADILLLEIDEKKSVILSLEGKLKEANFEMAGIQKAAERREDELWQEIGQLRNGLPSKGYSQVTLSSSDISESKSNEPA